MNPIFFTKLSNYISKDIAYNCVGLGWRYLLDQLYDIIKNKRIIVEQVKEKYGSLCFYVNGDELTDDIYDLILKKEEESKYVCEICGFGATTQPINGWFKSVCQDCFYNRIYFNIR